MIDYDLAKQVLDLRALARPGRGDKASCPECGDPGDRRDTLHVYDDHAYCFRCGRTYSAVDYLRATGNSDDQIASMIGSRQRARPAAGRTSSGDINAPSRCPQAVVTQGISEPDWQRVIDRFVRAGEFELWGPGGRAVRDYLRNRRGLCDHVVHAFRLGWNPENRFSPRLPCLPDKSGTPSGVFLPRGLMIPRPAAGGGWASLTVRRFGPGPKYQECRKPPGSPREEDLYPRAESPGGRVTLVTEGELDALAGEQEVGHLVDVVTAGSASKTALSGAARRQLAKAVLLLIATDSDGAGVAAAGWWIGHYRHKAVRVLMPYKDLSECTRAGVRIDGLVRGTLARVNQSHLLPAAGPGYNRLACVCPGDDPYAIEERAAIREEAGDAGFDPAGFA